MQELSACIRVSVSHMGKSIFSFTVSKQDVVPTRFPIQGASEALFSGVKRRGGKAYHSSQSSA